MSIAVLDAEDELVQNICGYHADPLGFVNYVYPWGEEGTILENEEPDEWQKDILNETGDYVKSGGSLSGALQMAVASGHGIGKGACLSWIIHWFISTRSHPQIVVTANTKQQLDTKTWRELAKWHNMSLHKHWFKWTATKFYAVTHPATWFAACIPWNEHKSEAFAGTHEKDVLIIYDEASMVPDVIWEVTSGAMTTPGAMWFVFGNPTMNTGRFRECFGKFRHRWKKRQIDSRTARMTNKKEIEKWIDDYGEDSDFVRVRVKGQFPRASMRQLISNEIVEIATKRDYKPDEYRYAPISIGADIARYGDDQTVFTVRQGVKVLEIRRFRELSTPQVAMHLMSLEDEYRDVGPSISVFIDLGYVGGAALDLLEQAGRHPIGVDFGSTVINKKKYFNKRIEMWGDMKEWLNDVGQIPEDQELQDDLIGPQYGFSKHSQLQLEKKEDMKSRGLSSPDSGDSLALTFAYPQLDTSRPDWYDKYGDEYAEATLAAPKSNSITGY